MLNCCGIEMHDLEGQLHQRTCGESEDDGADTDRSSQSPPDESHDTQDDETVDSDGYLTETFIEADEEGVAGPAA